MMALNRLQETCTREPLKPANLPQCLLGQIDDATDGNADP